ncbi:MAG: SH3 domain-containing protein [Clostridiales bacterium]|nr:SH3 domain-containing protein [Clostridiales bacterium]
MKFKLLTAAIAMAFLFAPTAVSANGNSEVRMLADAQTEETEPVFYMTTSRLNLRPTPSTSEDRLALVPQGTRVEILDFRDGEWYQVNYNGTIGYMSAEYLSDISTAPSVAVGEVELLEWRQARNVVTPGIIFTVVDVRTGLSYQIASFSNGNHADVETITPEDTATMLETYGGTWKWDPRPVLVLIDGRTIAASINGMPHGGSTRSGNNMNGQVCLHFLGSTTHRVAESHVRDHQNAVQEAYNTARSWRTVPADELFI